MGTTAAPQLAPQLWDRLTYVLLAAFVIVALLTFTDYGICWDEHWHVTYGDHIVHWYSSGFRDRGAIDFWNLRNYGGFFDVVAQLVTYVSPLDVFATRHLVTAAFALIAVVATHRLAAYVSGGPAAFVATLFLLVTPTFYGHAFINPKDIPFAALFMTALYYLIVSIATLPRPPALLVLKLGIAIGLALAVRIGGVVLFAYFALAALLWLVRERWRGADVLSHLRPLALTSILLSSVAYLAMLPWWPAAQVEPVMRPLKALWKSSHSDFGSTRIFFEGTLTPASALPRYALIEWQLLALPEFYLIAVLAFAFIRLAYRRTAPAGADGNRSIEYAVLGVAALFPIVHAIVARPVLYDAGRHYLFLLPIFAVLAAAAFTGALRVARNPIVQIAAVAPIAASIGITLVDLVRLHPYEYIFVNRLFAGGLSVAARSFETDYWGLSYKEGAEWIAAHYLPRPGGQRFKVASCSFPVSTTHFLPGERYEFVGRPPHDLRAAPELFLATPRWDCDQTVDGQVVHVVERQGAALLYVKEVAGVR